MPFDVFYSSVNESSYASVRQAITTGDEKNTSVARNCEMAAPYEIAPHAPMQCRHFSGPEERRPLRGLLRSPFYSRFYCRKYYFPERAAVL